MANIAEYLKKILFARYGRDVRQSIHDSIEAINTQVTECENSAYNSANSALQSATNAKASESNAATSANAASLSAKAAKTSEDNAKASENKIATYATNAESAALNAKASEENAKASENNAATSASNASTSATKAKTSEDNAKASENNAATSASNASTSADNASVSASNAAQSEANASTSASEAQECYDKSKQIYDNFQSASDVTGVKGSAEEAFRTGQVEITAEDIGLGNVDNTADKDKSVKYAESARGVVGEEGTSDIYRHVWFSHGEAGGNRCYNDKFKYNPVTNAITCDITGSATGNLISKKTNATIDFNDFKTSGIYHIASGAASNRPTAHQGTLFVEADIGTPYQIWMPDTQPAMYKRTSSDKGATWNNWVTMLSQKGIEFQIVDGELQYRYDTAVWG